MIQLLVVSINVLYSRCSQNPALELERLNLVAPSSARFWRVAGRASKYHFLYTVRYYTSLVWVWGLLHTYYGTTLASMYSNTIHTRIRMRRMSDAAHHRIQQIFHHVNPAIATCRSSINRQTARQVHS